MGVGLEIISRFHHPGTLLNFAFDLKKLCTSAENSALEKFILSILNELSTA